MIQNSATANPVLSATLTKFMQNAAGFVALGLAPIFLTPQQSAKYYIFDKENMLSTPKRLERAPSTPYARTSMKLSDDSYNCVNRGIEVPIDDEERAKYSGIFAADDAAMRRARNIMVVNHEIRVKTASTGSAVTSASPSVKWDHASGGDPVGDVKAAKEALWGQCGMEANVMVLPRAVYIKLQENPKIIEKIKYSERGIVTLDLLKALFDIPEIRVAGVLDNSAAEGQAPVPSQIWGDSVVLAHVEQSSDLQAPNFMRTMVWNAFTGPDGIMVESYRENAIQSDIHRAKQYTDEKVTGTELGYHLSDVLT